MNGKRTIYVFLFILFIWLRLFKLSSHPLWIDEGFTWAVTHLNITELVENRIRAGHLPFYFLFMKLWVNLFGADEFSLRFPSFLASVFSLFFFILLAKRILNSEKSRLLAFIIFGISPYGIEIAQEARMYSLAVLIFILVMIEILKLLNEEKEKYKIYIIMIFLFLLTGSIALIPFVILNLYLIFNLKNKKVKKILTINILCFLILSPLFYSVFKHSQFSRIENFYLQHRFNLNQQLNFIHYWLLEFFAQTAGTTSIAVSIFNLKFLSLLLILIPAGIFLAGIRKLNRPLKQFFLYYFGLSFIPFLFSYKIESRYLFYLFPLLAISWANWLGDMQFKKVFWAVITIWGLSISNDLYRYYTVPKSNWKEIAGYLDSQARKDEEIWLFPQFSYFAFGYYYKGDVKVVKINPYHLPSWNNKNVSGVWYVHWINVNLPWVGGKHAIYVDNYLKKLLYTNLKFQSRKVFVSQRGNTEVVHFIKK
jgi:uncharacterized membrane protein